MRADDLRELRRATKAVKKIARDIAEIIGPPPPPDFAPSRKDTVMHLSHLSAAPQFPQYPVHEIPQDYSYVRCDSCNAPAILVRDNRNECFAAACLNCSTITHLEAIIEVPDEPKKV